MTFFTVSILLSILQNESSKLRLHTKYAMAGLFQYILSNLPDKVQRIMLISIHKQKFLSKRVSFVKPRLG